MKILVTCPPMLGQIESFRSHFERYENIQLTTPAVTQTLSEQELLEIVPGHAGWIVGDDPVTERVLEESVAKGLKAVIRWGIGTDNIDFDAIQKYKIKFSNTPNMFGSEVADVAIGYLIGLSRELFLIDREVRKGVWPKPAGNSLSGKAIAVVGGGDIGSQIIKRVAAMNMLPFLYDPFVKQGKTNQCEVLTWPVKLDDMDFIVFACSLTDSSYHMFNDNTLDLIKSGVRIVNVSRGGVVEEVSLIKGLETGKIKSVALDVMEEEPLKQNSKLLDYESCVFGSHNSSNTVEGVVRASEESISLLLQYLGFEKNR